MTNYTIGMTIKSFDFPNNDTCFYVGKITDIKGDILHCDTISNTYLGKEKLSPSKTFSTPKQGCMVFDDKFERIVILS